MNEDGYTLAETLAALLIIGLAFTGLLQGVQLIARFQRSIAQEITETRSLRNVQTTFGRLFLEPAALGGRLDQHLRGDSGMLNFPCGSERTCSGQVVGAGRQQQLLTLAGESRSQTPIPAGGAARFLYLTKTGEFDHWPLEEAASQYLTAVVLVQDAPGRSTPLATAHIWVEQPRKCDYDLISRRCREETP